MQLTVNISDAKVSADPGVTLATYSLGSCIGVTLWDPKAKVAGMLHFQLPTSTIDADRARQSPLMFADTGFALLLEQMLKNGADKKRMKVRMAGAAQMLNDSQRFDIGRRNHAAMRKILWQHGMFIEAEHVGGSVPRSLFMSAADGTVNMKINGETIPL